MGHLGPWFSGGLGSIRLTVGLNDFGGIFQPKWLHDSGMRPKAHQRTVPCASHGFWAKGMLWTGALACSNLSLLSPGAHTSAFSPLGCLCALYTCSTAINITSFHHWASFGTRKSSPKAESGKVLLCSVNENTWVTLTGAIWLYFSFLGERFIFFKLTYTRSHSFYSGDNKPSFNVKLLFVREKKITYSELVILCLQKKSQVVDRSCAKSASERSQGFLTTLFSGQNQVSII